MADETTYYSDQAGVRVTDKRVIVNSVTYAMSNITSVETRVEKPSFSGPILFWLIGAALFLGGLSERRAAFVIAGAIFSVLGYFWFRGCKPLWHLRIASASGESTPLKSINRQWIENIARAINEAMIQRS